MKFVTYLCLINLLAITSCAPVIDEDPYSYAESENDIKMIKAYEDARVDFYSRPLDMNNQDFKNSFLLYQEASFCLTFSSKAAGPIKKSVSRKMSNEVKDPSGFYEKREEKAREVYISNSLYPATSRENYFKYCEKFGLSKQVLESFWSKHVESKKN